MKLSVKMTWAIALIASGCVCILPPVWAQTTTQERQNKALEKVDKLLKEPAPVLKKPTDLPSVFTGSTAAPTIQEDLNSSKARGLQQFDYETSIKTLPDRLIER